MLTKPVEDAINAQLGNELYAAYLYLALVDYFEALALRGFGHWMRVQAQEEVTHAMKLFDFIHNRGGRVVLKAIAQPPSKFKSPVDVMRAALDHERKVSKEIDALYALSMKEKDYPTQVMLHWFIGEQVEEERTIDDIVSRMELMGDEKTPLLLLDRDLAQRSAAPE